MAFDLGQLFNVQQPGGPGQDSFLSDPRVLGALLSAGGALAQPVPFGQSPLGHLFSGVGAAGESVRAQDTEAEKRRELESKQSLRESQAGLAESRGMLAESRAQTAGAQANTAAGNLEMRRLTEEGKKERNLLSNKLRFQGLYQNYVQNEQKANQRRSIMGEAVAPIMTPQEWFQKNGAVAGSLGLLPNDVPGFGGGIPNEEGGNVGGESPLLSEARSAISRGAPRDAVIKRLRDQGVDPAGL